MRRLAAVLVLLPACSGSAGQWSYDDAGAARDVAAAPSDAAPVDSATEADAREDFDVGVDAGTVDRWFGQTCFPGRPADQQGCSGGTVCWSGYSGAPFTGFDGGVEMHGRCSFACPGGDVSQCRDQSDTDAGGTPPGTFCEPSNNGTGGVSMGVCAPPPGYMPPTL